jgi:hypothetical protein
MAPNRFVHELSMLQIVTIEQLAILEDVHMKRRMVARVDRHYVALPLPCRPVVSLAQVILSRLVLRAARRVATNAALGVVQPAGPSGSGSCPKRHLAFPGHGDGGKSTTVW